MGPAHPQHTFGVRGWYLDDRKVVHPVHPPLRHLVVACYNGRAYSLVDLSCPGSVRWADQGRWGSSPPFGTSFEIG